MPREGTRETRVRVYLHPKNFRIYLLYINQPYLLLPNFLNTFCITTFKIHTWLLRGAWYCCNNKIWLFQKSTIDAGVKFARLLSDKGKITENVRPTNCINNYYQTYRTTIHNSTMKSDQDFVSCYRVSGAKSL